MEAVFLGSPRLHEAKLQIPADIRRHDDIGVEVQGSMAQPVGIGDDLVNQRAANSFLLKAWINGNIIKKGSTTFGDEDGITAYGASPRPRR